MENLMYNKDNFTVHDARFFGVVHEGKVTKVIGKREIPLVCSSYRVANVIISKSSPSIIFRLVSMDRYCVYEELYLTVSILLDSLTMCSVVGCDKLKGSANYMGDVVMDDKVLKVSSPIDFSIKKLTGDSIYLEESYNIVKTYLLEGMCYNKACNILLDSILHTSNFI